MDGKQGKKRRKELWAPSDYGLVASMTFHLCETSGYWNKLRKKDVHTSLVVIVLYFNHCEVAEGKIGGVFYFQISNAHLQSE